MRFSFRRLSSKSEIFDQTLFYLYNGLSRTWEVQYNFVGGHMHTYARTLWPSLTVIALLQFIVDEGTRQKRAQGP